MWGPADDGYAKGGDGDYHGYGDFCDGDGGDSEDQRMVDIKLKIVVLE